MKWLLLLAGMPTALAQRGPRPPITRLENNMQRMTESVNAEWGIYVKCLQTGEEIALNADRQMDTMSVIKLPLLAEASGRSKQASSRSPTRSPLQKRPSGRERA